MSELVEVVGAWTIPLILVLIVSAGIVRKVKVYEAFVAGAKEGFEVGIRIIPYLVAILVVVGMFRASGAMAWVEGALAPVLGFFGVPADVLPMALVRPMSGGAANGIVAEVMLAHTVGVHGEPGFVSGADTLAGRMVSVMAGSTETTFYVLAIYFGSVGIKQVRHALPAALTADAAGMIAAIVVVQFFFG